MKKNKNGMALVMALVFAAILLQMAIAYSGMTRESKPQTIQLDERAKLDYLARGVTELAVLKFRLFPADYYACWEAYKDYGNDSYLKKFTVDANEFKSLGTFTESISTFNNVAVNIQLATMTLFTKNKWKTEALLVQAYANYKDQYGRIVEKDAVKIVSAERQLIK